MSEDSIKDALKMIPYGFYAIASRSGEDKNIMVANWLTQVSFEPRLLALGLQKSSHTHKLVEEGKVFAVNFFNKADAELIKPFTKGRAKNPQKLEGAKFLAAPVTGCPVLDGTSAYLECKVVAMHDAGSEYSIVVGEVIGGEVFKPVEADETLTLSYLGWSYAG